MYCIQEFNPKPMECLGYALRKAIEVNRELFVRKLKRDVRSQRKCLQIAIKCKMDDENCELKEKRA